MAATTARFRFLATAVYGQQWIYRLAADRGYPVRSVHRWANGDRDAPAELMEFLAAVSARMEELEMRENIDRLVRLLGPAVGMNSLAGHLRDKADEIRTAPTPKDRIKKPSK